MIGSSSQLQEIDYLLGNMRNAESAIRSGASSFVWMVSWGQNYRVQTIGAWSIIRTVIGKLIEIRDGVQDQLFEIWYREYVERW